MSQNDLTTSININAGGNFSRQMRAYEQNWLRFSKTGQRQMGVLQRSISAAGRGLDRLGNRYTAILTGAGAGMAFKGVMDFDARLTQLGTQANKSKAEINDLRKLLLDTANDRNIRLLPEDLLAGVEKTVEKTGDLDLVAQNISNIGLAMRASGAEGVDMGALLADLSEKMNIKGPENLLAALDILVKQGEKGAFTLAHMAAQGPAVTSAYSSLGRTGNDAVKEMGALIQIAQKATGEPAKAATAFERLLSEMISKSAQLRKNGIEIWDLEEQKRSGKKVARSAVDIVKEIIQKTNGDIEKMQKIFGDEAMRPLKFLAAQYQQSGDLSFLDKFYEIQGDGSEIMRDAATNAKTTKASLNSLYIAYKRFADDNLAEPIQALADAINSLDPETVNAILKGVAYGGVALGGLVLGKKAFGLGKDIKGGLDFIRGKKGTGGVAGALGEIAGVQPVYVVNMPSAGFNGLPGATTNKVSKFAKYGKFAVAGAGIAGLAAAGYMMLDEYADKRQSTKRSRGAHQAGDDFDLADQFEKRSGAKGSRLGRSKLEIEVNDKRVQVKSIQSDSMDISVDTGSTVGSM